MSSMRLFICTSVLSLFFIQQSTHDVSAKPKRAKDWPYGVRFSTKLKPYTPKKFPDYGLKDAISESVRRARGFYLTPFYLAKIGPKETARRLARGHMNAVVIDIKGERGFVLHPSKVELSRGSQRWLIKDLKKTIKGFHDAGVHVIARVVCFKDSKLPLKRPDLSTRIGKGGKRLFRAGAGWLDAYSAEVQDYIIDVAREAAEAGADEIQLDYVRFPKGRAGALGVWLHQDKRSRAQLIANFLERADRALNVPISVDVFGLTTLVDGDPRGLGQMLEMMARYAEILSPMMYANGMASYFKGGVVTTGVYSLIHCGLWRTRDKMPNTILRPYLQSYPNNVPFFGESFIKGQIRAAYRAGANGFLFWNATMRNATAYRALRQMGTNYLDKLGNDDPQRHQLATNQPTGFCHKRGNVFRKKKASKQKKSGMLTAARQP
jgi:hypothetical protein